MSLFINIVFTVFHGDFDIFSLALCETQLLYILAKTWNCQFFSILATAVGLLSYLIVGLLSSSLSVIPSWLLTFSNLPLQTLEEDPLWLKKDTPLQSALNFWLHFSIQIITWVTVTVRLCVLQTWFSVYVDFCVACT